MGEEDEGKVQVNQQPPTSSQGLPGILASASPWNTEESMGRLLSSKTSSNILPEAEHSKGRSFQELCSVLQRDRAYSKFLPSVHKSYQSVAVESSLAIVSVRSR